MKWFWATAIIIVLSFLLERPIKVKSQNTRDSSIEYVAKKDLENKIIIKRLAKKQDSSLNNLSDAKQNIENIPKTKLIYKTLWKTKTVTVHDTIMVPAEPFDVNDYIQDDPVVIHDTVLKIDTVAMTKKQIRNFRKHKN